MYALSLPVLAAGIVALYAATCAVSPWGRCLRCKGERRIYRTGKRRGPGRKCPRCRGTGIRLRIGRRIFNYFHDARDRATARPVPVPDRDRE